MNKFKRGETNPAVIIVIIMMAIMLVPPITMLGTFTDFKLTGTHILGIVIGIIVLWCIIMYNSLVKGKQRVKQASSGIDVYLKQRFDLIPNIVETVKGYAKHEKETLFEVIKLRDNMHCGLTARNFDGVKEINRLATKSFNSLTCR